MKNEENKKVQKKKKHILILNKYIIYKFEHVNIYISVNNSF